MAENSFADMLTPGESVLAQLEGEGRRVERGNGMERTWWQLGLTQNRFLVIRMRAAAGVDRWELVGKVACPRGNLRIAHFPRTNADTARLSIDGCGDRIVLIDVDKPPVLPQVQPFLTAWGGVVLGGDSVALEQVDSYNENGADSKKFLIAGAVLLLLFAACCGCLGLAGVLRLVLQRVFGIG